MRRRLLISALLLFAAGRELHAQADGYTYGVQDRVSTGTLGALDAAVTLTLEGTPGAGGYLALGTLSGTVTPEALVNTTWVPISFLTWSAGAAPTRAATIAASTLFQLELPAGARQARIRVSSYTSGSGTGTLVGTAAEGVMMPSSGGGGGTSSNFGAAFPAAGTAGGWYDGTNMQGPRVFDLDTGGGTQYVPGASLRIAGAGGSSAADAGAGATGASTVRVEANQGAAAAGAGVWPMALTDTANTIVKPADAANNAVRVNVVAGGAAGGTSSNFGAAFPAAGTAGGLSDGTNMQGGRAVDADTGGGTIYVQGVNLLKRASGGPVEAGTSTDPLRVDTTGTTTQPISGAVNQGTPAAIGNAWPFYITDGLDIALVTAGGSLVVTGAGGTFPSTQSGAWILSANSGVDIGDVTINNAAGAAAVNIQDGGNSITVDGTVTTTPPSNASTNVAQFGGTNVSTGTGASGAGIPRFTISNDSAIVQGTAAASTAGWPVTNGTVAAATAAWTSATAVDTTVSIAVTGYGVVSVGYNPTGVLSGGTITFEASDDAGTTWYTIQGSPVGTTGIVSTITVGGTSKALFQIGVGGFTNFRLRLNPVITGGGTVNVRIQAASVSPETYVNMVTSQLPGALVGSRLDTNLGSVAGTATVTAAAGVQKVGIVGNANAAFDAANNAAPPANVIVDGFETATQTVTQPAAATAGNVRRGVTRTDGALYVVSGGPVQWQCNLGAVGTTLTQCQAAPGAGLRLYITDIVAISTTTTTGLFTLRFGTGANCGTGTGNLFFASAAATMPNLPNNAIAGFAGGKIPYITPVAVTANNAVCVLGVVTNTTNIQISGYTAP